MIDATITIQVRVTDTEFGLAAQETNVFVEGCMENRGDELQKTGLAMAESGIEYINNELWRRSKQMIEKNMTSLTERLERILENQSKPVMRDRSLSDFIQEIERRNLESKDGSVGHSDLDMF